jgi:hypothetical protein
MASGHSGAQNLLGGGTTERGEHGELGSSLTGAQAAAQSGARAEPEEGDDRWGPPVSRS